MGTMVLGIAFLYSQIFEMDFRGYLAWLATSFLTWGFLSAGLGDGCTNLVDAESNLRSVRLATPLLAARVVWRNIIIFGHNLLVIGLVLAYAGIGVTPNLAYALPGFAMLALFVFFMAIVLGPLSLRFRDVAQIVSSFIQIMFFVTPIIWTPTQGRLDAVWLDLNPFYHLLELVRAPLLGTAPTAENWMWGAASVMVAAILSVIVDAVTRRKIYLWL